MVSLLLAQGADVHQARTSDGMTMLMTASERGHVEVVLVLLANGADVKQADAMGYTALTWASQEGHSEVVRLLLARGADVNHGTTDGSITALMLATQEGHAEVLMDWAMCMDVKQAQAVLYSNPSSFGDAVFCGLVDAKLVSVTNGLRKPVLPVTSPNIRLWCGPMRVPHIWMSCAPCWLSMRNKREWTQQPSKTRACGKASRSLTEHERHTFLTNKILLSSWEMKDKGEVPITLTS